MFRVKQIQLNKIKIFFLRLPRILGEHSFLTFLVLIFLALISGGLIFYKYSILMERTKPEVLERPLQFQEKTFQEILKIWENRQKKFEETELKEYPDLFREIKEKPLGLEQKKLEEEITPESPSEPISELPTEPKTKELERATTLDEFYKIRGEIMPSVRERAKIWEEKGLGSEEEYIGSYYQNQKLLAELKKS